MRPILKLWNHCMTKRAVLLVKIITRSIFFRRRQIETKFELFSVHVCIPIIGLLGLRCLHSGAVAEFAQIRLKSIPFPIKSSSDVFVDIFCKSFFI